MVQQGQEVGGGILQLQHQRMVINGCNADLAEIRQASGVVGFCVPEGKQHVGILGTQRRRKYALIGKYKIAGYDCVSV